MMQGALLIPCLTVALGKTVVLKYCPPSLVLLDAHKTAKAALARVSSDGEHEIPSRRVLGFLAP